MQFLHRAAGNPQRLGILSGSFNPVTVAHLALAGAAREHCDEIVFVLPRVFPHKDFSGATLEERLAMLHAAAGNDSSVAVTEGGLFTEIARECRASYGNAVQLWFICGRDAAERVVTWDYGRADAFAEMLGDFGLLVAARRGEYLPPEQFRHSIVALDLAGDYHDISSTEVRRRIAEGGDWEHLVPAPARPAAGRIYR